MALVLSPTCAHCTPGSMPRRWRVPTAWSSPCTSSAVRLTPMNSAARLEHGAVEQDVGCDHAFPPGDVHVHRAVARHGEGHVGWRAHRARPLVGAAPALPTADGVIDASVDGAKHARRGRHEVALVGLGAHELFDLHGRRLRLGRDARARAVARRSQAPGRRSCRPWAAGRTRARSRPSASCRS